jgi:hypothetical protein
MTKFREIELPDGIIKVFQQIILDSDDDTVLSYAEFGDKSLIKGIRPIKENAGRIKQRMMTQLGTKKTISKDETFFLLRNNPFSFLDGLEEQTILTNLDELCSVVGADRIMACLLLSRRADLQALAKSVILGERAIKALSEEEKKTFTVNTMQAYLPFLESLQNALSDGAGNKGVAEPPKLAEAADADPRVIQLENKITVLNNQLEQAKKDIKHHKQMASQAGEFKKKMERSEKAHSEIKAEVADLKSQLAEKNKELASLDKAIESTVTELVESALHSWIRHPHKISTEVDVNNGADLVERAKKIIEKQQDIDKHAGNRRVLSQRLDEVTHLRDQVRELGREAIHPLAELGIVGSDLEKEITRLMDLLGQDPLQSDFAKAFEAKIGLAVSPDEILEYKQLLGSLKELKVLGHSDIWSLYEYCDRRMALVYDKFTPDVKIPKQPLDPVYRLKRTLADNTEMIWLIDGHNVLFSLPEAFGTFDSKGLPTEESRQKLCDLLVQISKNAENCQIHLFYDSPTHSEYRPSKNVKVIYSGGTGEHRADDSICVDLEYCCRAMSSVPTLLTTDDWDLRSRAKHLAADLMWVDEFFGMVRSYNL